MIKRKPLLFAKYAGRIDDKLIPKLSEQEIKEQEQEFERIKNLLTNCDNETSTSEKDNGMVQGRRQLALQRPP